MEVTQIIELIKKKEAIKEQYAKASEELEQALLALPVGKAFQDEGGLVYKVVVPTGTYVTFKPVDYVRTKKKEETKGSLSKKEAESLGFTLKD